MSVAWKTFSRLGTLAPLYHTHIPSMSHLHCHPIYVFMLAVDMLEVKFVSQCKFATLPIVCPLVEPGQQSWDFITAIVKNV